MKRILAILLALTFCCALIFCAYAAPSVLDDSADILTDSEETALHKKLSDISEKHDFDVVITTTESLTNYDILEHAEDYYERGGYAEDGIILVAYLDGTNPRYGYVVFGEGNDIFDDSAMDDLDEAFVATYKSGDFAEAFTAFADQVEKTVDEANAFPTGTLGIAVVIGALLAWLIPMSSLKGELKSVRMQAAASSYVRPNSMVLTQERDMFLFRNVTRVAKPKNHSSSRGGTRMTSGGNRGRSG